MLMFNIWPTCEWNSQPFLIESFTDWYPSQAAIKEAMRLAPTNALPLERIVPSEGLTIGDYNIPSGTIIGASAYIVHRDQQIYGSDVNTFRPERWLDPDTTTTRKMQSHFFAVGLVPPCRPPGVSCGIVLKTTFSLVTENEDVLAKRWRS